MPVKWRKGRKMIKIISTALDNKWIALTNKMRNGTGKKIAGDSHFMSVLVTIVIVLVVAVMYRENISTIFTNFFSKTTTQINGLFP